MTNDSNAVFAAIADPTRRQLLEWLQDSGSSTATELANRLPITRQAVSKHLHELESAGLVASTRIGRETRYAYRDGGLIELADWIEAREETWKRTLVRLRDHAEQQDLPGDAV